MSKTSYEFWFPNLDTLVLVEEEDDQVRIRTTRDSFSEKRKASFVRELVSEAFISEAYRWAGAAGSSGDYLSIVWQVDRSWAKPHKSVSEAADRAMAWFLALCGAGWAAVIVMLAARCAN